MNGTTTAATTNLARMSLRVSLRITATSFLGDHHPMNRVMSGHRDQGLSVVFKKPITRTSQAPGAVARPWVCPA
jgi:hypothetical protein